MQRDEVSGLVLAGGAGARMGAPKAFVTFAGLPLLSHAVRALQTRAAEVAVACGRIDDAAPWLAAAPGARLVPDPGDGPMAGLRAGAAACTREWLLVVPVDAPLVSTEALDALFDAARGRDGAVAVVDGRDQPLLACYHRARLTRAAARVRLPRELPGALDLARLDAAHVASLPHGEDGLRDADTPEALAALAARVTRGRDAG